MTEDPSRKLAYTVGEAATLLSISRAKLYRLIDLREIGSVKIGRSRRITWAQLEAYAKALEGRDRCAGASYLAPVPKKRQ